MFHKQRLDSGGICLNYFATQLEGRERERERERGREVNHYCVCDIVICSLAEQTGQRVCEHGQR